MTPQPQAPIQNATATPVAVGVDLGGTNLKVALVDDRAQVLAYEKRPTGAERGAEAVIDDIVSMVESILHESERGESHNCVGVGVGAPGPLSVREGRVYRMANLAGWNDVPLRDRVQQRLGMPVVLDNDGNAAALGEYWARRLPPYQSASDGRKRLPPYQGGIVGGSSKRSKAGSASESPNSCDDLVMLTLGTGVGAGIVIGGRLVHGHFENAAEIGHMIVVRDGEPCRCGQRGCLERYASAEQVVARVVRAIKAGESCALKGQIESGLDINASHVAEAAGKGDASCARIWDDACTYLAMACVNIQHIINPARIVLGGGMTAVGQPLLDAIRERVRVMTWKLHEDAPTLELSRLGENTGVVGAAALQLCR